MAQVFKHPKGISDHCSLILDTAAIPDRKSRDFHFEISWLKDPRVISRIQEIWMEPTRDACLLDSVHFKLKRVRKLGI
jgi:hypothetical protein